MRLLALSLLLLSGPSPGGKWSEMDYGPFMTHSFESDGKDLSYKGIRVRLGPDGASMLFDADLLRWSAGWLKSSLDWKNVVFDGSHGSHPMILGNPRFANPRVPGVGAPKDPRPLPYGPLPNARYRGLYLNGERVIVSYTVGATRVLELAALEGAVLTRTIETGRSDEDLEFQVCAATTPVACAGAILDRSDPAQVRLRIAASATPARMKIAYGADSVPGVPEALEPLTHGGPLRWPQKIETRSTSSGDGTGPFVTDTLVLPSTNPWHSWMRPGGFDFFSDPTRAALCTWSGDVWTVSGIGSRPEILGWQRIATGLFQPLGLKIVDDRIYVTCRDQIARLHDLNGDGEADFIECFHGDTQVTDHFHEFAMGLQTDAAGNFYYAKAARHAMPALVSQHGTLIRVSPDGSRSEIVCNGFRAPNGVGIGPGGEIAVSDQEGHWTPANRINLVRQDGFYGNKGSYLGGKDPKTYDPPVVWLHPKFDRSPAEQLWVTGDGWGPLKGSLLSTSYGTGQLFLIPYEVCDGVPQGCAVPLPLRFPTGILRGRFHPRDGQLYVCGLVGWSTDCAQDGGLYRVRYTGRPIRKPVGYHVAAGAIELTFPEPLDRTAVEDPEGWSARQWNYRWTAQYGSKNYKVSQPEQQGEDEVGIGKVSLRGDRTVVLSIPELRSVMTMEVAWSFADADGGRISGKLQLTIHTVPR